MRETRPEDSEGLLDVYSGIISLLIPVQSHYHFYYSHISNMSLDFCIALMIVSMYLGAFYSSARD